MRRWVLATALIALLSACENATPVQVGSTATVMSSPSPDTRPSATSSGHAQIYPYSLPWPVDQVESDWQFATVAWDGTARIDHGNRYTDSVETRDGSLFAFGLPMSGRPEDLRDLVAEQAQGWHGCKREPSAEEPVEGGGADGILGVYACGPTSVLRWSGVHEGFGLFVGLIVAPGSDVDEVEARFKEHLGELEWTG